MSAAALSLPVSEKVRIRTATVPVESNGGVGEGGGTTVYKSFFSALTRGKREEKKRKIGKKVCSFPSPLFPPLSSLPPSFFLSAGGPRVSFFPPISPPSVRLPATEMQLRVMDFGIYFGIFLSAPPPSLVPGLSSAASPRLLRERWWKNEMKLFSIPSTC